MGGSYTNYQGPDLPGNEFQKQVNAPADRYMIQRKTAQKKICAVSISVYPFRLLFGTERRIDWGSVYILNVLINLFFCIVMEIAMYPE